MSLHNTDNVTDRSTLDTTDNDDHNNTESNTSPNFLIEDFGSTSTSILDGLDILVMITGVVGVLANGFVSASLARSKQLGNERVNLLVLHQTLLDFLASFMMMVIYSIRVAKIHFTGSWGYWLCMLVVDEFFLWITLNGSTANLVIIGVERYVMIAHPIWHKKHMKKWMTYVAIAFCWIDGILLNAPVVFSTSGVVNGECVSYYFWSSPEVSKIYGIWYFIYFYVSALVAFVYCYGRILVIVSRRLVKLVPSTTTASTTGKAQPASTSTSAQTDMHHTQMNVLKTMMTITLSFIVCWLPNTLYYFLTCVASVWNDNVYKGCLALAFLNICLNPIIYASQYDVVRRRLKQISGKCRQFVLVTVMKRSNQIDVLDTAIYSVSDSVRFRDQQAKSSIAITRVDH